MSDTAPAQDKGKAPAPADQQANADRLIAEGKKAIALKQWEEAVGKYADALDIMREIVGEFDPKMAPLLLSYGKALYELAFSTQGAIGKEEVGKTAQSARKAVADDEEEEDGAPGNKNFSFAEPDFAPDGEDEGEGEGDAEGEGEGEAEGEGEEQGEGDGEGAEEPEDDYGAAWEVLDVARTIYTKFIDDHSSSASAGEDELKTERLQLADTYIALGDVSCETENFAQAVSDYTSALEIQSKLLPPSSRSLASTHYQLATSLEFLPQKRAEALSHVQSALGSFKALRAELEEGAVTTNEGVKKMSAKEKESERKDVDALVGDLEAKIEELKTAPETADDIVKQSLDHLLGGAAGGGESSGSALGALSDLLGAAAGAAAEAAPVNDLTSMVRKKPAKKAPQAPANSNGNGSGAGSSEVKRKAEDEAAGQADKKAKAE